MKSYVLVYGNRKQEDMQFPFSTQKEKEVAFLKLFKFLKVTWKVYEASPLTTKQKRLYELALTGDGKAAIILLTLRKQYDYEQWHIEEVPVKDKTRVSTKVVLKPFWSDIKKVRTRIDGLAANVCITLANGHDINFSLVPIMATERSDWDYVNQAEHFIIESLSTEWKHNMFAKEGLKKALDIINELRHALQWVRYPETASPTCTPDLFFNNVMTHAESILTEYSNTPIEKLATKKRVPTSLEEAKEKLAEARRCIGSLSYFLKKAGKTEEFKEVQQTYKSIMEEL
jgi:hypothetical protein